MAAFPFTAVLIQHSQALRVMFLHTLTYYPFAPFGLGARIEPHHCKWTRILQDATRAIPDRSFRTDSRRGFDVEEGYSIGP